MSETVIVTNSVVEVVEVASSSTTIVLSNERGPQGANGQGVPTGGTTGQVLAKASATNYDTEWVDGSVPATPTVAGVVYGLTDRDNTGNTALGDSALLSFENTADPYHGGGNIALGSYALNGLTSGSDNVAIGGAAMDFVTESTGNVAIGTSALAGNPATGDGPGVGNTAIGLNAGSAAVSTDSVMIGRQSGGSQSGDSNVTIGPEAGFVMAGSDNVAIGRNSGNNSTASSSVYIGVGSGFQNDTDHSLFIGGGTPLIGGTFDPLGGAAGQVTVTGTLSVNDGTSTSEVITSADAASPTVAGIVYGLTEPAHYNTAVGQYAMEAAIGDPIDNDDVSNNVAVGNSALWSLTDGVSNVAVGPSAMESVVTGHDNLAFGYAALNTPHTANFNVAIGQQALSASTGEHNLAIGWLAGSGSTGSNNVLIGNTAGQSLTADDTLIISNSSTSTPLIAGTFDPLGEAAGQVTITGTLNVSDGTSTEPVVLDNDARLTNSRTPTAHAASHGSAGSDPVTIANTQVTGLGTASTHDASDFDPAGAAAAVTTTSIGAVPTSEKGAASGVATLGVDGLIPNSQLPALAITDTFVVGSQSAMLALTAQVGDVAVRTDLSKSFILTATPASTLGNWQELLSPPNAVTSVNGQVGAVSLSYSDVGADAAGAAAAVTTTSIGAVPTTRTVNSKALSSDITLSASDVGADPAGSAAAITLSGLGGVPTTRTVNGKALSSDVTLSYSDVGADAAGAAAAVTTTSIGAVPTSRSVSTTSPLAGGGSLTGDLTLSVGAGSTSAAGVVQLEDSTSSTSTTKAATPNSVKSAYDLAAGKVATVSGTAPITTTGTTAITVAVSDGSTSAKGVVQLTDSTSSTSTTTAATPNSVKSAYDLAAGKVASVGGTAPIASSGGTTPTISIAAASTTGAGAVQLTDSTSSTSTTTAATPNAVKSAYDLANGKPSLSSNNPVALGSAAPGSGSAASKDDHVHPTTGLALLAQANTFTTNQVITPATSVTALNVNAASSSIGIVVKSNATTPGNLQEWQTSAGNVVARVTTSTLQVGHANAFPARLLIGASDTTGALSIVTHSSTEIGAVVRGAASQTANLQEWQNSSASILAKIDSAGLGTFPAVQTTNTYATITEENSGGRLRLTKMSSSAANPGADLLKLYVVAGTNAGTLKLVVRAGASGAETTILDNIPQS